ncbi:MAG: hypothetical protein IJ371_02210 [Clostridia bacterium]|nr:hypothetical protein [Clostridia bacterium]
MIITSEYLEQSINQKIKYFSDKTYILSIINTEESFGVVCYLQDDVWQPFCYDYGISKFKCKAKTYRDLINNIPPLNRNNIADIKGKFYNTFDTPVEVNNEILTTTFEIIYNGKDTILERKTYYLITDVQELERTFNSNIMPCEIIDFNGINELHKEKEVDDSLKFVIENILK